MPSPDAVLAEKERLYELSTLRDDLNDAEATRLLQWGEAQLERLAAHHAERFEALTTTLHQLIKALNRVVGLGTDGSDPTPRLSALLPLLAELGLGQFTVEQLRAPLPADPNDMAGTLEALLGVFSPSASAGQASAPPSAPPDVPVAPPVEPISPPADVLPSPPDAPPASEGGLGSFFRTLFSGKDAPADEPPPRTDTHFFNHNSDQGDF